MKRSIQSQMNEVLRQIGKTDFVYLNDEAETYICALCDMERKPCEIHAGTKCSVMIRSGTELEFLQNAEKQQFAESYGTCTSCGNNLDQTVLARNPLAELCGECSPPPKRIIA